MKMAVIKNNDIYIFAHLSAILNLCKLDRHIMERCVCVHKWAFDNILKYYYNLEILDNMIV